MSSSDDSAKASEPGRNGEIDRLRRLRAFGDLRRSLRVANDASEIATVAQSFAIGVLGCTSFAIYAAEKESSDFELLSASSSEGVELPSTIERMGALGEALAASKVVRDDPILDALRANNHGGETVALSLRGEPALQVIGALLISGAADALDAELLEELTFDVESALSAAMITKLRAEELAVLEIQERELVGLLRDVEARDQIIQRDLEEARLFQRKMLGAPPRVRNAWIEVVYRPLGLVGGDLYAVSVDGNRLRLFIADATGHGVRASLTTMFIKSGYEAVRPHAETPAELLSRLNDAIASTYRSSEMLFSAACVDLELDTGKAFIASAAHPAICIVHSGFAQFLEGGGAFLGLRTGMKYTTREAVLEPGDGLYLVTDGFAEARKQNEQFGDERLRAAIVDAHGQDKLVGEAILDAVTQYLEGTPLDDDGTFVGVRFGVEDPAPSVRETIQMQAVPGK